MQCKPLGINYVLPGVKSTNHILNYFVEICTASTDVAVCVSVGVLICVHVTAAVLPCKLRWVKYVQLEH